MTIYTVDSGIRTSHQEFQPWGGGDSRARLGPDFVDDDDAADDCDGHGTWFVSRLRCQSACVPTARAADRHNALALSRLLCTSFLPYCVYHSSEPNVGRFNLECSCCLWKHPRRRW